MCKYLVIISLIAITASAGADYIFELASEYEIVDIGAPWAAVCMDDGYLNDDAYPDMAAIYCTYVSTYLYTLLGNGDCTFSVMPTELLDYPLGSITVNDFDNDGYDDLLLGEGFACIGGGGLIEGDLIHLFKGNGDGTFTELDTLHVMNVWVTSGDLNADGYDDLVVSGFESDNCVVSVKLGNGDFTFQSTESYEIRLFRNLRT